MQNYDGFRVVVVMLVQDADDVGLLLRTVQEWARQQNSAAISFQLDGRRYSLEAWDRPAGVAA